MIWNDPMLYPSVRLPAAYQEVEWVGSTGTQYFVTDAVFNEAYVYMLSFKDYEGSSLRRNDTTHIFGVDYSGSGSSSFYYTFGGYINGDGLMAFGLPSYWWEAQYSTTDADTVVCSQSGVTSLTKTYVGSSDSNGARTGNIALFGRTTTSSSWRRAVIKVLSFSISLNGVLVLDLVPCYRKSDGEIGMYDLVGGRFYTNQGTGTFNKGSNVN